MFREIRNRLTLAQIKCSNSLHAFLNDQRGELDEKAILIAFFVIVVAAAVTLLGNRVGQMFRNLAGMV